MSVYTDKLVFADAQYRRQMADLEARRQALDITNDEARVGAKRARDEAGKQLFAAGQSVAADLLFWLRSSSGRAADDYKAKYWDALDRAKVDTQADQIQRRLERSTTRQQAEGVIAEAMATKEGAYALWKVGPQALSGHRDIGLRALAEKCEDALALHLAQDAGYQQAVATQNETFARVKDGITALFTYAPTAAGGLSPYSGSVFGEGATSPTSLGAIAELFTADGEQVTFKGADGQAASIHRHEIQTAEAVGALGPL